MMIVLPFLLAILQTSLSAPTTSVPSTESSLLAEIINALPRKDLMALKAQHLKTDKGFQAAMLYFKSPEWKSLIDEVRKTPEWIAYKDFLKEAGLDLDYLIKHLDHCLNATDISKAEVKNVPPTLTSFIEDLKKNYAIQVIKGLHTFIEKFGSNVSYRATAEKIKTEKSKEMLEKALEQPALKKIMKELSKMGLNVEYVLNLFYAFNGWDQRPLV